MEKSIVWGILSRPEITAGIDKYTANESLHPLYTVYEFQKGYLQTINQNALSWWDRRKTIKVINYFVSNLHLLLV